MRKLIMAMAFCLMPCVAQAGVCICPHDGNFSKWVGKGWAKFVAQFAKDTLEIEKALVAAGVTSGAGGVQNAETEKEMSKRRADADAVAAQEAAHNDRVARAQMEQADILANQDTVAQQAGSECGKTIAAEDGEGFARGANNARVMESVIADAMNRDAREEIKQGTDLLDYRKKMEKEYARGEIPRDFLPADGGLTYTQKQLEYVTHMSALAMNPEGRLPSSAIGLKGKDAEQYDSLVAQKQYLTSIGRSAMADYITDRAPLVPSTGVHDMVKAGGNVNGGSAAQAYKAQNGNVSRLAQRQAWVEHYMSPAIGKGMNAMNAMGQIYEVAARIYALQVEEVSALKRAAALMGLMNGDALATLEKRLDAASTPR